MKTKTSVNCQIPQHEKDQLSHVTMLADRNEKRIERTLNSVVHVKGQADILIKHLLSPLCSAAVVIRRGNGSYNDPCDFGASRH